MPQNNRYWIVIPQKLCEYELNRVRGCGATVADAARNGGADSFSFAPNASRAT